MHFTKKCPPVFLLFSILQQFFSCFKSLEIESEQIMANYKNMAKRQRKGFLYVLGIIAVSTAILPYKHFFLALLLGAMVSLYNLWLLQRKTDILGESVAKGGKRTGLGTISRLAAAALGTLLVIRYELSIAGFVIGLTIAYFIIMIDFLLFNRNYEEKEG